MLIVFEQGRTIQGSRNVLKLFIIKTELVQYSLSVVRIVTDVWCRGVFAINYAKFLRSLAQSGIVMIGLRLITTACISVLYILPVGNQNHDFAVV